MRRHREGSSISRRRFGRWLSGLAGLGLVRPARADAEAWVRPDGSARAEPVWGHRDGLRIGLAPLPGPRGLIRIYAPYLGQKPHRVINFIAVEPIVAGQRCLSEIERSGADGQPGKRMISRDDVEPVRFNPLPPPSRGVLGQLDGVATLTVFIHVEPLANGARPIVAATFRAGRPFEVTLQPYSAPGGTAMEACVLTATMGNYARIRRLWLAEGFATPQGTWPEYTPDGWGFSPWHDWPTDRLGRRGNDVLVAGTSDEADPASAEYDRSVGPGWRYQGRPATQSWRCLASEKPVLRANSRRTYWASQSPIPGGPSFENFELLAPFRPGQAFHFGVIPKGPEALGFSPVAAER